MPPSSHWCCRAARGRRLFFSFPLWWEYPNCAMTTADAIYQAVKPLPEPLAREVLDFVEFLRRRGQSQDRDLMLAQQSSLNNVWDNADDEVWN